MPYITSVERMGRAEGLAEGELRGQRATLLRMARARFGSVPESLEQRIALADREILDRLTDRISTATSLDEALAAE